MELNKRNFKRFLTVLILSLALVLAGCGNKEGNGENNKYYDNENDAIVFSSQEVDRNFNPFFATSGADGQVVGMTQISMLSNNKLGEPTYGDNEAVVVKDLELVSKGSEANDDLTTTYYFVLKNNVRFSNGSYLTIKDVLFNLYVYLDNAYTGSSTIYSTDIVGLKQYRTQTDNENEQDNFNKKFEIEAETRIQSLVDAATEIYDEHDEVITLAKFKEYLNEKSTQVDGYKNIVKDFNKADELFQNELNSDYNSMKDAYKDRVFKDEKGNIYKDLFTTDAEEFLFNNNLITWNKKEAKLESALATNPAELKKYTEQQAIDAVYNVNMPSKLEEIVRYWKTSNDLSVFIANEVREEYFSKNTEKKFKNIEGIKFANMKAPVTVNGKQYATPEYNADGSVKSGNEVLSIEINGVDPKAIWNFAFAVAPMYYYSDQEHIDAFDFEENFGVEFSSQTFMDEVVKHIHNDKKSGVPVGAGPYAASKAAGGFDNVELGDFCNSNVIYFERNPYFVQGPAKIKKLRFQVVPQSQMVNKLTSHEIDFGEPNANPETKTQLNAEVKNGIENKSIRTSGYGYIGINAGKVPDLGVRQIIMHTIDTSLCVQYYKGTAQPIHRSMSYESWAYPKGATAYYPYLGGKIPANLDVVNPVYADYVTSLGKKAGDILTNSERDAFIKQVVEDAGYTLNGAGIYEKNGKKLEYTFTIAGQETDHPAFDALFQSKEILNQNGFEINVLPDAQALTKLSNGSLTVWAAAWGSTIDPDMYQVYHIDSKATSTLNWGYRQIKANAGNKYDYELAKIEELSEFIEKGRKTTNQDERKVIYSKALDIVMELAIELPTYQRDDLFAYNANKIDKGSLTPQSELSPFKGLTSSIWNVSLNTEK